MTQKSCTEPPKKVLQYLCRALTDWEWRHQQVLHTWSKRVWDFVLSPASFQCRLGPLTSPQRLQLPGDRDRQVKMSQHRDQRARERGLAGATVGSLSKVQKSSSSGSGSHSLALSLKLHFSFPSRNMKPLLTLTPSSLTIPMAGTPGTYPWQSLLFMQCCLGFDGRVSGTVCEEGATCSGHSKHQVRHATAGAGQHITPWQQQLTQVQELQVLPCSSSFSITTFLPRCLAQPWGETLSTRGEGEGLLIKGENVMAGRL